MTVGLLERDRVPFSSFWPSMTFRHRPSPRTTACQREFTSGHLLKQCAKSGVKLGGKIQKSFEPQIRLRDGVPGSAEVTDKHRNIKPRMNTNWNAEDIIYNKLVSIRVYSWLTGHERSCIRVIRKSWPLFSGNWCLLVSIRG